MDVEQLLRREFAARTAVPSNPADLAGRAIVRAAGVRRRRMLAGVSATAAVVVIALAVGLMRAPRSGPVATPPDDGPFPGLSGMRVGPPPKLALYGPRTLRLPSGVGVPINKTGDRVTRVERAAGGWAVVTQREGEPSSLWMVRDDGVAFFGAEGVVGWALSRDGNRIALQTLETRAQPANDRVDIYDFAAGRWVASTPLPGLSSGGGPHVYGWVGSLVVLVDATTEGVSRVDVWDPAKGVYRPSPVPLHVIGATPEQDQLLGIERGVVGAAGCLVRMDPAAGFAVTARACETGYRYGTAHPLLSPDGNRLTMLQSEQVEESFVLDVSTMAPVPPRTMLPLPEGVIPIGLWWEDPSTVLFRVVPHDRSQAERLDLLRCRFDGSGCEVAPAPKVDGADPIGVVQ